MQWVIRGAIFALSIAAIGASAQGKPRARALGIPFEGTPGPLDAITDVAGVDRRPHHDRPGDGR